MDWTYRSSPDGNVVQTAQTGLDGVRHRHLQLALGLGGDSGAALANARTSMKRGFGEVARAYAAGWHRYLGSLKARPASAAPYGPEYDVSLMTLAAHEDKTHRGAFIASPTMPWSWGTGFEQPTSGVYHAVWSRDLYQIVTALMAAGDRGAAERALTFVFEHQQKPDGSVWQNTFVDGTPHWTNVQMDEVAFPIVLAWQLGRDDADTYSQHVKPAADYIVANGPRTNQDRWENEDGWSPGTIGAEIAGRDRRRPRAQGWRAGRRRSLRGDGRRLAAQRREVDGHDQRAVLERSVLRAPDQGRRPERRQHVLDRGQRAVRGRRAHRGRHELPRARAPRRQAPGRPDDPQLDRGRRHRLAVDTPNGRFWHRFDFDGYGEQRNGAPWDSFPPDSQATLGRAWPIFAGERGEYELAAGATATAQQAAMAGAANDGYLIPAQVWDDQPPSGQPGFPPGEGTLSATPLAWSHAQFVRLAWSITAGHPVEQPTVVACRYVRTC
jgi:glucoamylase